jgi:hypothetical protein
MFRLQYWMILIMVVRCSRLFPYYLSEIELFYVIQSVIIKSTWAADSSWWSEGWYELLILYEMLCWTFSFFQNIFDSGVLGVTVLASANCSYDNFDSHMLSVDQWRLLGSTPGRFGVLFKHWNGKYCVIQNVQGSISALPLVLKLGWNMQGGFFFTVVPCILILSKLFLFTNCCPRKQKKKEY